jgi:uncharacterized protein (TIGR03083 family)
MGGVVDKVALAAMFDAEYGAFLELARTLTPEEWDTPSLCTEWSVGDVVLHLAYHTHRDGLRETAPSMEKVTAKLVAREHAETREGLLDWLSRPVPASAQRAKGNVCELVIHSQDIRRAIRRPREYPESTFRLSLDTCATVLGTVFVVGRTHRVAKGLRLAATDIEWTHGSGPEVTGTAEALLMAIAARPAALADLSGEGVATMAARLGVATPSIAT